MSSPPTIDFRIAPHLADLLDRVRSYVDDEARPAEAVLTDPADATALRAAVDRLRDAARERGLFAPQLPQAWGGQDIGPVGMALISEQCGACPLALLGLHAMAPDDATMQTLLDAGTPDQHERFLRPLIDGQAHSCFAMTEPDSAGSDPTNITTTAVRDGEHWILNGDKWLITGAAHATFAIVVAKTTQDEPVTHTDFSLLLVPTNTPGWHVVHQPALLVEHIPGGHAEIALRDVRVPAANLLGTEGDGFQIAQQRLARGRLMHAMRWIGLAQHALDLAACRATTRRAFGRELAEHQAIQHFLADSAIDLYASRLMVLHSAWKLEHDLPHRQEISMVKTFVAEAFGRITDRAVQIYGSHGITADEPIAGWWAQARAARISDGPSEVHRMVIARQLLRLARDNQSTRTACGDVPSRTGASSSAHAAGGDSHSHADKIACAALREPARSDDTGATAPADQSPDGETYAIRVSGKEPVGGVQKVVVGKGDRVRFTVTSDQAEQVHVHAYDVIEDVRPGAPAHFDFAAEIEGVFEVELERAGVQILSLTVNPR